MTHIVVMVELFCKGNVGAAESVFPGIFGQRRESIKVVLSPAVFLSISEFAHNIIKMISGPFDV